MLENLNNFAGFNLGAVLFALIFSFLIIILMPYVIWPVVRVLLIPIVSFTEILIISIEKVKTLFKKREQIIKERSSSQEESTDFINKIIDKIDYYIATFIKNVIEWFSKKPGLRTFFFIIIPFVLLTHILEAKDKGLNIFRLDPSVIENTIWDICSAGFVSIILTFILKAFDYEFKKAIPIAFFTIYFISVIHYFF